MLSLHAGRTRDEIIKFLKLPASTVYDVASRFSLLRALNQEQGMKVGRGTIVQRPGREVFTSPKA